MAKPNARCAGVSKSWQIPGRLAGRNAQVMPVGAWVQPESVNIHQTFEAVVSAADEEARIKTVRDQKAKRLQQFQADVKNRVALIDYLKHQQQLAQSYKAIEIERNIVGQSTKAAERHMPRINRCLHRDNTNHTIKQSGCGNTQGGIITDSDAEAEKAQRLFSDQSEKVHQFTSAARRKLTSKRVITEQFLQDDLPGGVWKTGATRDHPASRQTGTSNVVDLEDDDPRYILEDPGEGECDVEVNRRSGDDTRENSMLEKSDGSNEKSQPRVVHFDPEVPHEETRFERIARKSAPAIYGSDVGRVLTVPNIYPGVTNAQAKQHAITQRAMYRRLFMDSEREQVKENQRANLHRKKVAQLKRAKEEDRRREELVSQLELTAQCPTSREAEEQRRLAEQESTLLEAERKQQAMRMREATRFMDALKAQLQEKIVLQNVDLPPLCCCGPTVWDTSPDTCANNCIFYHNPKAYTRALQSLLSSCDMG